MPRVPDASSVTRLRAIQSSAVADPVKRSASYVPAQPALLYSLRASDSGRGMFPAQSYLSNPVACGWVNPRHRGLLAGQSSIPRIVITITDINFNTDNFTYIFAEQDVTLPPGPDFDVVLVDGEIPPTNVADITSVFIFSSDDATGFDNTTITLVPEWPGSTFTSSATIPSVDASMGTFPGMSTIIQFRNVPVIENLRIRLLGAD